LLIASAGKPDFVSMEHIHVLLNHLPVIGLAMGILALVLALLLRSRPAQVVALVLLFAAAASAWPVMFTGQRAYKPMRGLVDDAGSDWLDAHKERAEKAAPAFYLLAVLTAAALLAPRTWPRIALPLTIATLALAVLCEGASIWIALAGGQIRHPEFRSATANQEYSPSPRI
jgi:hypothetical protein